MHGCKVLTTGSRYDKKVMSCLWKISQEALTTLFKGRGVSSDFAARKSAATAINCNKHRTYMTNITIKRRNVH